MILKKNVFLLREQMVLMKEKSELTSSLTIKKETRIKNVFESLLEYLREVYFANDHSNNETNSINNSPYNNMIISNSTRRIYYKSLEKIFPMGKFVAL